MGHRANKPSLLGQRRKALTLDEPKAPPRSWMAMQKARSRGMLASVVSWTSKKVKPLQPAWSSTAYMAEDVRDELQPYADWVSSWVSAQRNGLRKLANHLAFEAQIATQVKIKSFQKNFWYILAGFISFLLFVALTMSWYAVMELPWLDYGNWLLARVWNWLVFMTDIPGLVPNAMKSRIQIFDAEGAPVDSNDLSVDWTPCGIPIFLACFFHAEQLVEKVVKGHTVVNIDRLTHVQIWYFYLIIFMSRVMDQIIYIGAAVEDINSISGCKVQIYGAGLQLAVWFVLAITSWSTESTRTYYRYVWIVAAVLEGVEMRNRLLHFQLAVHFFLFLANQLMRMCMLFQFCNNVSPVLYVYAAKPVNGSIPNDRFTSLGTKVMDLIVGDFSYLMDPYGGVDPRALSELKPTAIVWKRPNDDSVVPGIQYVKDTLRMVVNIKQVIQLLFPRNMRMVYIFISVYVLSSVRGRLSSFDGDMQSQFVDAVNGDIEATAASMTWIIFKNAGVKLFAGAGVLNQLNTLLYYAITANQEAPAKFAIFMKVMGMDMANYNHYGSVELSNVVNMFYGKITSYQMMAMLLHPQIVEIRTSLGKWIDLFGPEIGVIFTMSLYPYFWVDVLGNNFGILPYSNVKSVSDNDVVSDAIDSFFNVVLYNEQQLEASRLVKSIKIDSYNTIAYSSAMNSRSLLHQIVITISGMAVLMSTVIPRLGDDGPKGELISFANKWSSLFMAFTILFAQIKNNTAGVDTSRTWEIINTRSWTNKFKKLVTPKLDGRIELKDITYFYDGNREGVENLNLTIEAGERIALVGMNGSGKSTAAKIIVGLIPQDLGTVYLGGHDTRSLPANYIFQHIGMHGQGESPVPGSIYRVLTYGHKKVTPEVRARIAQRLKDTGIQSRFANRLNEMFDEKTVSGSQAKRLTLTGVLSHDRQAYIVDEPLSSSDPITSQDVTNKINETLPKDRTILMVTHNIRLAQSFDRIIAMKDGKILQTGTHDELLAQEGLYRSLYTAHTGDFQAGSKTRHCDVCSSEKPHCTTMCRDCLPVNKPTQDPESDDETPVKKMRVKKHRRSSSRPTKAQVSPFLQHAIPKGYVVCRVSRQNVVSSKTVLRRPRYMTAPKPALVVV